MKLRLTARFALAAVALTGSLAACGELDIQNPNAPERERAFSDPATIAATAAGTMKTFYNARFGGDPALTLSPMADQLAYAWNNWNARYYSSYGVDCPTRCAWVNSTSTQLGNQVQPYWYQMYSVISSANDALYAIRVQKADLGADAARVEAIAQLAQAMGHGWLAMNYDKAFIVDESVRTPEQLAQLQFSDRAAVRAKAIELFDKAYALANGATFNTGGNWFGATRSPVYSSKQLTKIIRTMQAELLANYPRNSEENAQVNWGQVLNYASNGVSSSANGTPGFDFTAFQDANLDWSANYHQWAGDYTTVRVDTRTARLLAVNQADPWPGGTGNPQPVDGAGNLVNSIMGAPDRRLGDGCFDAGTGKKDALGVGECIATPRSGTAYMWSPVAIQIPGRGSFHQSNIGYFGTHCLAAFFPDCPSGEGPIMIYSKAFNDLLWAEALIRTNGSRAQAAEKINNSRVGKGGLPALLGSESDVDLLKAMIYEQDIELFDIAPNGYYNRRRYTSSANQAVLPEAFTRLWPETPRQMPVPAKDLQLLRAEIYTFGGLNNPGGVAPGFEALGKVRNVHQIAAEFAEANRAEAKSRRRR